MPKFSVLIPIFFKADASFLQEALDSVLINQSYKPTEVVLIVDGTPTKLINNVLIKYKNTYPDKIKIKILSEHKGTGYALKTGIEICNHEFIARMDADDIATNDRFEKQLNFIIKNPQIDVLGGIIEMFNHTIGDLKQYRKVPENHANIIKLGKFRTPINHPTVLFKKSKVLQIGNYSDEFPLLEDYALWITMLQNKMKFHNLQEVLVHFRLGDKKQILEKRRGKELTKSYLKLNQYAHKIGFYTKIEYYAYSFFRILFFTFFPSKLFLFFHKKITQKKS